MSRFFRVLLIGTMLLSGLPLASVQAQSRMSDKDVEATMRNLREDAKSFRSAFDSSVEKSTIRKTSREKDAKAQVRSFQDQTETLLNQFKKEKQANDYLPSVMDTASQIDVLLRAVELESRPGSNRRGPRASSEFRLELIASSKLENGEGPNFIRILAPS
jgi:hypothetical protein